MFKERVIGVVAAIIYWLYSSTFRYKITVPREVIADLKRKDLKKGDGLIYAFWHQDELAILPVCSSRNVVALVSHSKDGTMMDSALHFFGLSTVRGSSSRGGVEGLLSLIREVSRGYSAVIAVDGPRGPIYEAKEGVFKLSEKSGRPIVVMRAKPQSFYLFHRSWNQGRLPYPFSRVEVVALPPAFYDKESFERAMRGI